MADLTSHEIEVLQMVAGHREATWGAWVAACLERLRDSGLITQYVGMQPKLTDAGAAALKAAHHG